MTFLGVRDGVARLRLTGSCHGCPSSTVTVRLAIERAIEEAAPEVRVEVEDMADASGPGALLQIGRPPGHPRPEPDGPGEWLTLEGLADLEAGRLVGREAGGLRVVLCRLDGSFYAYRDGCPACQAGFPPSALSEGRLRCPGCGQGYDVRRAGRSLDGQSWHLQPLPLLAEAGQVRIAVPGAAAVGAAGR